MALAEVLTTCVYYQSQISSSFSTMTLYINSAYGLHEHIRAHTSAGLHHHWPVSRLEIPEVATPQTRRSTVAMASPKDSRSKLSTFLPTTTQHDKSGARFPTKNNTHSHNGRQVTTNRFVLPHQRGLEQLIRVYK